MRWRHPYAPKVKRRYLHQLVTYGAVLREWRADLMGLLERPHAGRHDEHVAHAMSHSPHWRSAIRRPTQAATQALPILRRADVQQHLDALTAQLPRRWADDVYEGRTSGSTGEPLRYRIDGAAFHSFLPFIDFVMAWRRAPRRPRFGDGFVLLDALGHSPEYSARLPLFHGARFAKLRVDQPGWRSRLARLNPAVITGDPDSLSHLLTTRARPGVVLSSAFALPEDLRMRLQKHLGCPVVEYYSAQELGPIAVRCGHRAWHVLTPFVDVSSVAVDGGYELVISDWRNRAMPLFRYAPGDLGRVIDEPCGCGLYTPQIVDFTGRVTQRFTGPAGVFDPARLAPDLARLPLDAYRLSQTETDAATLEYEGALLDESSLDPVRGRLSALAKAPMRLTARQVTGLRAPGVKPQPFVPLNAVFDVRAATHHDAPRAGRPHRIYVAVTNACNRACPWCSTYSDPTKNTWITPAQLDRVLPETGEFELQLEGGEPTLHPQLDVLVDLALATERCTRVVLCTNAVRLPRDPVRLAAWLNRWPRPMTIKASLNHHLIERDAGHTAHLRTLVDVCEDNDVDIVINLRRRRSVDDTWVAEVAEAAGLMPWCNDFFLQRYGLASDDDSLEPPYLAGTDFTLVNPDGERFGTDLIARSEAMGTLV